jgi:hypothetical protein
LINAGLNIVAGIGYAYYQELRIQELSPKPVLTLDWKSTNQAILMILGQSLEQNTCLGKDGEETRAGFKVCILGGGPIQEKQVRFAEPGDGWEGLNKALSVYWYLLNYVWWDGWETTDSESISSAGIALVNDIFVVSRNGSHDHYTLFVKFSFIESTT